MFIDPVCKMDVPEANADLSTEYNGERYYFCNNGCLKQFREKPEKFIPSADADYRGSADTEDR